jgi:thymidine kinase
MTSEEYQKYQKLKRKVENLESQLEKEKTKVIILDEAQFGRVAVTECCQVGPITSENYCPNCGKQITDKTNEL